jgi:hypothetical protein
MKNLPKRTGESVLDNNELIILDALAINGSCNLNIIRKDNYPIHMSCSYRFMIKYLKYLILRFTFSFDTKLSIYELRKISKKIIESPEAYNSEKAKEHKDFIGEINHSGFNVIRYRSVDSRGFVRPKIFGKFEKKENGSRLSVNIKISLLEFLFIVIIPIAIVIVGPICFKLLGYDFSTSVHEIFWVVNCIIGFAIIMTYLNFSVRDTLRFLISTSIIKRESPILMSARWDGYAAGKRTGEEMKNKGNISPSVFYDESDFCAPCASSDPDKRLSV